MKEVGDEMQQETGALRCSTTPLILDLCMAPGGYTFSALKCNPRGRAEGITLPPGLGGHEVIVPHRWSNPRDSRVRIWYGDLPCAAAEFGAAKDVEESMSWHPDAFVLKYSTLPLDDRSYHLIFADGQMLDSHAPYRKKWRKNGEASRLTLSQLIIAVQHIKAGGTLIMLLHGAEKVNTFLLLHQLDKVSTLRLFKPKISDRYRGSFYAICQKFQPTSPIALEMLKSWKERWRYLTFQTPQVLEYKNGKRDSDDDAFESVETHPDPAVKTPKRENKEHLEGSHKTTEKEIERILKEWGDRFVNLTETIWAIQLKGLENPPWRKSTQATNLQSSV